MSTTSTVTTLVAHDLTLGNDSKLLNCMYVLVIARGNGTPFNATSIQEEDIIELCLGGTDTPQRCALAVSIQ